MSPRTCLAVATLLAAVAMCRPAVAGERTTALGVVVESTSGAASATSALLRVGFQSARTYSSDAPADGDPFLAVLTLGIATVPADVWVGNVHGAEASARISADRVSIGVSPVLRVSRPDSIFTSPSVLGFVVPDVGITLRADSDPAIYVRYFRLPLAAYFRQNVGLEMEIAAEATFFLGDQPTEVRGVFAVSLVTR